MSDFNKKYQTLAQKLVRHFQPKGIFEKDSPYVIGIAGESGAGKTSLALNLGILLTEADIENVIISQDDFYYYPPLTNDEKRRADINHVGESEVNLNLMDEIVLKIKKGEKIIKKPWLDYKNNRFYYSDLVVETVKIIIVEGTYVFKLASLDCRVFFDISYKETREGRHKRKRHSRELDGFTEKVLEIEHKILKIHKLKADIIINRSFEITECSGGGL